MQLPSQESGHQAGDEHLKAALQAPAAALGSLRHFGNPAIPSQLAWVAVSHSDDYG